MEQKHCVLDEELDAFTNHIQPMLKQIYFFGYPLDEINNRQVFRRLASTTEKMLGFCYESSAIIMIALRDVPKTKLVRGISNRSGWHSWVEVDLDNITLSIDCCWIYSDLDRPNIYSAERERFYKAVNIVPKKHYTHEEFWNYELSQELYNALSNKKSALASCLLSAYRPKYPWDDAWRFSSQLCSLANNNIAQRHFIAQTIREGFLPHHPQATVKKLMEDTGLGFNFKQPSTLTPAI